MRGRTSERIVVVGGGVVGLSVARRLAASSGRSVIVMDAHPDHLKSTWAAAGMLSPLGETGSQSALLELGKRSLGLYPAWIADLTSEGLAVPYSASGRLDPAMRSRDAERLRGIVEHWRGRGEDVGWLSPAEVAARAPALATTAGAAWFPGDAWVDARALLVALRQSAQGRGVDIRSEVAVSARPGGENGIVVHSRGGTAFAADRVVVAAGAWSGGISGTVPSHAIEPVRGDMLALSPVVGPSAMLHTPDVYTVTRPDRILVGASMMREGFDHEPRHGVIDGLRAAAERLWPALSDAEELERWAGVRPGTVDGLPILGIHPDQPRLIYATGHFRNGILLAPVTAECVEAEVAGRPPPLPLLAFTPDRFAPC